MSEIFAGPSFERLAMTLFHFIWQGLLIVLAVSVILGALRTRSTEARYAVHLVALAAMAVAPPITFLSLGEPALMARIAAKPDGDPPSAPAAAPGPGGETAGAFPAPAHGPRNPERSLPASAAPAPSGGSFRAAIPWALTFWTAGVLALSTRLLFGAVALGISRRRAGPIPPWLLDRARRMTRALGSRCLPEILTSPGARDAFAAGLLRPAIILPVSWLTLLPPEALEAVIVHELSHIRRLDLWVNLFQRVLETLLFYHPAVWWLSRRLRSEREMCCDRMAAGALEGPVLYAEALERIARLRLEGHEAFLTAGMGGKSMTILHHVRHVLGLAPIDRSSSFWPAGALSLGALLIFWAASAAAPAGEEKERGQGPAGKPIMAAPRGDEERTLRRDSRSPAIDLGLAWLARHQDAGGGWSTKDFDEHCTGSPRCDGKGTIEHEVGLTGLAVLAFIRAGHLPDSKSSHAGAVKKAIDRLMEDQGADGCFPKQVGEFMYDHAIAGLAISEAARLTHAKAYGRSAQKGIDFLLKAQNPGFAWRYEMRCGDNDTSVTGWCVQTLASAGPAGLRFDRDAYQGAREWLRRVTNSRGVVGYQAPGDPGSYINGVNDQWLNHPTMTAVGLSMKLEMDGKNDDPWMKAAQGIIMKDLPSWDEDKKTVDFYYWHSAVRALLELEAPDGTAWKAISRVAKETLVSNQSLFGGACKIGSWNPKVDKWGPVGGRVYATALNVLTLELIENVR